MDDPLPTTPVVVTGLMGAGKTTVASGLAQRWGRTLRDSDADLRALTGRKANELLAERGADGLHDLEQQVLLAALDQRPAVLIAAAASTIDREACRSAMRERAVVVWLDADPAELVARQRLGGYRPQFSPDLLGMLTEMDARRRPLFEATAQIVIRLPPVDPHVSAPQRERSIEMLLDDVESRLRAWAAEHAEPAG